MNTMELKRKVSMTTEIYSDWFGAISIGRSYRWHFTEGSYDVALRTIRGEIVSGSEHITGLRFSAAGDILRMDDSVLDFTQTVRESIARSLATYLRENESPE
jgi:hypothetical protein